MEFGSNLTNKMYNRPFVLQSPMSTQNRISNLSSPLQGNPYYGNIGMGLRYSSQSQGIPNQYVNNQNLQVNQINSPSSLKQALIKNENLGNLDDSATNRIQKKLDGIFDRLKRIENGTNSVNSHYSSIHDSGIKTINSTKTYTSPSKWSPKKTSSNFTKTFDYGSIFKTSFQATSVIDMKLNRKGNIEPDFQNSTSAKIKTKVSEGSSDIIFNSEYQERSFITRNANNEINKELNIIAPNNFEVKREKKDQEKLIDIPIKSKPILANEMVDPKREIEKLEYKIDNIAFEINQRLAETKEKVIENIEEIKSNSDGNCSLEEFSDKLEGDDFMNSNENLQKKNSSEKFRMETIYEKSEASMKFTSPNLNSHKNIPIEKEKEEIKPQPPVINLPIDIDRKTDSMKSSNYFENKDESKNGFTFSFNNSDRRLSSNDRFKSSSEAINVEEKKIYKPPLSRNLSIEKNLLSRGLKEERKSIQEIITNPMEPPKLISPDKSIGNSKPNSSKFKFVIAAILILLIVLFITINSMIPEASDVSMEF